MQVAEGGVSGTWFAARFLQPRLSISSTHVTAPEICRQNLTQDIAMRQEKEKAPAA